MSKVPKNELSFKTLHEGFGNEGAVQVHVNQIDFFENDEMLESSPDVISYGSLAAIMKDMVLQFLKGIGDDY